MSEYKARVEKVIQACALAAARKWLIKPNPGKDIGAQIKATTQAVNLNEQVQGRIRALMDQRDDPLSIIITEFEVANDGAVMAEANYLYDGEQIVKIVLTPQDIWPK